jgi:hypothetical protein
MVGTKSRSSGRNGTAKKSSQKVVRSPAGKIARDVDPGRPAIDWSTVVRPITCDVVDDIRTIERNVHAEHMSAEEIVEVLAYVSAGVEAFRNAAAFIEARNIRANEAVNGIKE